MEDRERERKMKLKFCSKRFLFNNGRIYKEKDDGYPFYSLTTIWIHYSACYVQSVIYIEPKQRDARRNK